MKKIILILIAAILFFDFNAAVFSQTAKLTENRAAAKHFFQTEIASPFVVGQKRAFLVGISTYLAADRKGNNWENLVASNQSLKIMTETLVNVFIFDLKNIEILTDEFFTFKNNGKDITVCPANSKSVNQNCQIKALEPNKKNIEERFKEFLIKQTAPNDVALFYFIGHGQSIKNVGQDTEADNCDETLVPKDYKSRDNPQNNILDDEIEIWTNQLLAKSPAQVTFIFDSCQSGTANRGADDLIPLGGHPLCLPDKNNRIVETQENIKSLPETFVFLSASQDNELANVDKEGGIFTFYLVEALKKATSQTTYYDLIETVRQKLAIAGHNQTPQVLYSRNQQIFGGNIPPPQDFFTVKIQNKKYVMEAGKFQGITIGSKFEIYPNGTKKSLPENLLGTAIVTDVSERISTLKITLDKGISKPANSLSAAFEVEHNFDSILKIVVSDKLKIAKLSGGAALLKLETKQIAETVNERSNEWNVKIRFPFNCPNEKNDRICQEENDFRGIVLQRRDGSIIERIADGADLAENVKKALQRESYFFIFRSLFDNKSNDSNLQIKLLDGGTAAFNSQTNEYNCSKDRTKIGKEFPDNGNLQLAPQQCYWLEVKNNGNRDLYISIFNWEAKNHIQGVFPTRKKCNEKKREWQTKSADSNLLAANPHPNQKIPPIGPIMVREVFGREKFLMIATAQETDFSLLTAPFTDFNSVCGQFPENSIAAETRGIETFIGKLLINSRQGKTIRSSYPTTEKWGAAIFSFNVVPK